MRRHTLLTFISLSLGLSLMTGCGRVSFSTLPASPEQGKGVVPGGGNPGGDDPVNPITPENPPRDSLCGGGDPNLFTGYVDLVKSQSGQLFNSYASCSAERTAIFGNGMVCSENGVAATILGCLQTADYQNSVMELTLALPILKATGQMKVPYDYYLLGVPNCTIAANYINANMGAVIPTAGGFTPRRAEVRAECLNATDVVIHVLRLL